MTTTAITLRVDQQVFPIGTSVSAYLRSNWSQAKLPPSGAPVGSAAATATVASDGTLAFTGLTAAGRYFATASVSGTYRYVAFAVGDQADLDPGLGTTEGELAAHEALTTTAHGGLIASSALDTDSTMAANSDAKVASQKASKAADAANLAVANAYADALNLGRQVKDPVRLATQTALPTNARVTNVLTATAFGALAVDGVNVAVGDRILVKNESTQANNGIYVVTATGGGAAFYVLTRATDANTSANIKSGMSVFAGPDGSLNANSGWELTADDPITLNTTNLTFQQFTALGEVSVGSGLTKSGNTLAADFGTASGKVTQGNDSRLSDARTPTAHASAHLLAGLDALALPQYDRDDGQAGVIAPLGASPLHGSQINSWTANSGYMGRFVPSRNMTITKIAFSVQAVANNNDNVDVGILNATLGTLIVSSGATAGKLNATGDQTVTVASTPLTANTVYYAVLVMAVAGTAATLYSVGVSATGNPAGIFGTGVGTCMTFVKALGQATLSGATFTSPSVTGICPILAIRES